MTKHLERRRLRRPPASTISTSRPSRSRAGSTRQHSPDATRCRNNSRRLVLLKINWKAKPKRRFTR